MSVSTSIDVNGGVLVAHDGSAPAEAALRTAARIAAAFDQKVTVVRAWSLGTAPRPESAAPGYMPPFEDFEAATLTALEEDVAPVRAEHPDVTIVTAVVHGGPAEAVIEASAKAELVVVGNRGRGGFAGLLLGSVSEQVVRHAACPVLVGKVREGESDGSAPASAELMEQALASELKLD